MAKMFPTGASQRQRKVGQLVQRYIMEYFSEIGFYEPELKGAFINIPLVHVSPDLRHAKVFVSILNTEDPQASIKTLGLKSQQIRHVITPKLKLRFSPELYFVLDTVPAEVRFHTNYPVSESEE